MRKFKEIMYLILGLFCIIYYLVCIAFAHIGVSWLWIWPIAAAFCIIRFIMLKLNVKVPKVIAVIYHVVFILFMGIFIFIEAKVVSAMFTVPKDNLDYIITLGAAVRNGVPTSPLALRIDRTYLYLLDNPNTKDIASGGQGKAESMSEAACISSILIESGISKDRILLEDKATDTVENIKYSYELIPEGSTVGIVTNSFHIYRAVRVAQILGHETCGVPATTYPILGLHYIVREFFAVVQLEVENQLGLIC